MEPAMYIEHLDACPASIIAPEDVLVFKTSVSSAAQVHVLQPLLDLMLAETGQWNFDLEDCDRILRVESATLVRERIKALLAGFGYVCVELE